MVILLLAARSAWNRRLSLALMLVTIALATTLLLGIERVRQQVRVGFAQSIANTDLVVGARSSPVQLVLYAVFRLGGSAHNVSWPSVQRLAAHPSVAWTVPLSLGDSHRGFPVLATSGEYFSHYRYGNGKALALDAGRQFDSLFDAVLGAEVARELGYRLGDRIVLSHGGAQLPGLQHADKPFTVVGILAPTGTPVDRTVHIELRAMQAIHLDWEGGAPIQGLAIPPELVRKFDLTPTGVTAVLVGMKLRSHVFALQREIASDWDEALTAVLPGVALDELWSVIGYGERAMLVMSGLVVFVGLAGLVSTILAALGERRRELALLRAAGASPGHLMAMLALEGLVVVVAGAALGLALLSVLSVVLRPWLESELGVALSLSWPTSREWALLGAIVLVGFCASLLPGWRAYRISMSDGLFPN
jgi:putative ABC transport system permease protein